MGAAGGGRVTRALRLLLLLVLALAAVEYLFGSILEATPLRTYLYAPMYNATPIINCQVLHVYAPYTLMRVAGGWRVTRTLCLVLLIVLSMAGVEYLFGSILDASPLRTKLYATMYNTLPTIKTRSNVSQDTSRFIKMIMEGNQNLVTTEEGFGDETSMPMCDEKPPDLGPVLVNKTELKLDYVEQLYPEVRFGGLYSSPNCTARHRVAIIVPYRDRLKHLPIFLNHMHPFLIKQQIEYGIYIVEQEGTNEFNRAKLMNVGFVESLKHMSWQCFIFHDIDFLPLDSRNYYSCEYHPRHMSVSIEKFKFRLPYENFYGGVVAMTLKQFSRVNGFSNRYWGWGGEDDDMFYRLKKMNYRIVRYKRSVARYTMLDHKKSAPNPKRFQLLLQTNKIFLKDGLSTLEYELVKVTPHHLYTHILVNIDERSLWTYLSKLLFGDW